MPYVTCGGDVYRIQAIGYFDDGGVSARIEAIIDASTQPATVLFWRDISHLGRGFTLEELGYVTAIVNRIQNHSDLEWIEILRSNDEITRY